MPVGEPLSCYVVLYRVGGLTVVFVPGEGIHIVGPEDPGWGKRVAQLDKAFDAAHALVEVGMKNPAIREQCFLLAKHTLETQREVVGELCQTEAVHV